MCLSPKELKQFEQFRLFVFAKAADVELVKD
jgi:hypothetical protein